MTRHSVGPADEIEPGEHRIVDVGPTEVSVFNIDGSYHALPNICPHQYGPLCDHGAKEEGTLVADVDDEPELAWDLHGKVVACPWHNLEFNIETGECLSFQDWDLNPYEVTVEDGELFIEG